MSEKIIIDGANGGDKILRTSLSLAAIQGRILEIHNIRAGRPKHGLQDQHYTCIRALVQITNAETTGTTIVSTDLIFSPPQFKDARPIYQPVIDCEIDIGTAGSTMLIVQTVMPVLLFCCAGQSRMIIKGGTHNGLSPSSTFILETFLPILKAMRLNTEGVEQRIGFAPAGQGQFLLVVNPVTKSIPIDLTGCRQIINMKSMILHTPCNKKQENIVQLFKDSLQSKLQFPTCLVPCNSVGFGFVEITSLTTTHGTMILTSTDYRSDQKKIEEDCLRQLETYTKSNCFVDEFLADQLLLPAILGSGIRFRATMISEHFVTNVAVLEQFFGKGIVVLRNTEGEKIDLAIIEKADHIVVEIIGKQ
jgi:RNA 3'-terminal phosphate cyclase (ATP)